MTSVGGTTLALTPAGQYLGETAWTEPPFALSPHPPRVYTSRDGWSVQWYPASAVFPERPPATSASPSASQLRLDFTNPGAPAEDGELAFTGGPARGHSADEIVTSLQQANAPDAVPDYVMPGASLGYTPATARRSRSRPAAPTATRSGSR